MYGGQSGDFRSVFFGQVFVVATAEHLGSGLDAAIVHELVEDLSSMLVELATSAVALDCRLNTPVIWSV